MRHVNAGAALLLVAGLAAGAGAGPIEVIFTNIPGHPKAVVPGTGGNTLRHPLIPIIGVNHSPNGQRWIYKCFLTGDLDAQVVGAGTSGAAVAIEGNSTVAIPGRPITFTDSDCGINDAGVYAYGVRLDAPTTNDEAIIVGDGLGGETVGAREGDAAPGLTDNPPANAGNEIFGNSLNSAHVLDGGTVAFFGDQFGNCDSNFNHAIYHGSTPLAQEGTVVGPTTFDAIASLPNFASKPDGTTWVAEIENDPTAASREAVYVSGSGVVIQDGDPSGAPGIGAVDNVFDVDMDAMGNWYARGDDAADNDWALRNGVVVAATGQPIHTGAGENWGPVLSTINGAPDGRTIIGGETDNADPNLNSVIVFDDEVVVREGDRVDANDNGMDDDDVFIATFDAEDAFVSSDGYLYFLSNLRDGAGTALGQGFLRIDLTPPCPPGDVADSGNGTCGMGGDGNINSDDYVCFLSLYASGDPLADVYDAVNGVCGQSDGNVSSDDYVCYLSLFASGCP